jgi:hypothetical protein
VALALAVLVRATGGLATAGADRAPHRRRRRGAAPAGWLIGGRVGLALVALAANQAVIGLARATAWKPRTISVLLPVVMVAAAAIAALTVPIAVGLGRGPRAADRRRRRAARRG